MAEGIPARLGRGGFRSRLRGALLNVGLMAASLGVALLIGEGMVRAFYPVADGRANVTLDGQPIRGWFPAGTVYRQVSNEYDARTTITPTEHRVPGAELPDVVFLGDSFTYGYGLNDDETFASIYCQATQASCANLGIPGSGTVRQVRRLSAFIDRYGWKPKEVKVFFFGMSGSFSAGNDFADNFEFGQRQERLAAQGVTMEIPPGDPLPKDPAAQAQAPAPGSRPATPRPAPSLAGRIIGWQSGLLEHSHLMRRVKFHWGPLLKSVILNRPENAQMADALRYTKGGLQELDALSRRVGFDYTIYLIVPVQDVIRGTHGETLKTLNDIAPKPAISTAPLFTDQPQDYYYAYDGHLNPKGSRRVAEFLIGDRRAAQR